MSSSATKALLKNDDAAVQEAAPVTQRNYTVMFGIDNGAAVFKLYENGEPASSTFTVKPEETPTVIFNFSLISDDNAKWADLFYWPENMPACMSFNKISGSEVEITDYALRNLERDGPEIVQFLFAVDVEGAFYFSADPIIINKKPPV